MNNRLKEIFRDIEGYEGIYMISNLGNVKSLARVGRKEDIILKPNIHNYYFIGLHKNGRRKLQVIHRLVAEAFIPNPLNKPEINHIDSNKLNNNINNLEYSTHLENMLHAKRNGLLKPRKGEQNGRSKLTEKNIIEIKKLLKDGLILRKIAKIFNVTQATICYIKKNKSWKNI